VCLLCDEIYDVIQAIIIRGGELYTHL
jgi:hypothetical protein